MSECLGSLIYYSYIQTAVAILLFIFLVMSFKKIVCACALYVAHIHSISENTKKKTAERIDLHGQDRRIIRRLGLEQMAYTQKLNEEPKIAKKFVTSSIYF